MYRKLILVIVIFLTSCTNLVKDNISKTEYKNITTVLNPDMQVLCSYTVSTDSMKTWSLIDGFRVRYNYGFCWCSTDDALKIMPPFNQSFISIYKENTNWIVERNPFFQNQIDTVNLHATYPQPTGINPKNVFYKFAVSKIDWDSSYKLFLDDKSIGITELGNTNNYIFQSLNYSQYSINRFNLYVINE